MTRYTKLEGRRALPSANPVALDENLEDFGKHKSDVAPAQENLPDPKKLLKRAKLLRLKAKKTNSGEAKAKHTANARKLEHEANQMNGARGILGKRKHGNDTGKRDRRPRLGTFLC